MQIKYRFSINGYLVKPIYDEGLTKEYQPESEQAFFRAALSGKVKFQNSDFDWLMSQQFETEFVLLMESCLNNIWSEYWKGRFFKTDCIWNEDDRIVDVKLDIKDQYTNVLSGIDKEYNLIKLAPAKTPLTLQKRPLIQLYIPGDKVVSCFLGGNYWEQDVNEEILNINALKNKYYFALATTVRKINVTGTGTPSACLGDYVGETTNGWKEKTGTYKITEHSHTVYNEMFDFWYPVWFYKIVRIADSVVMFTSDDITTNVTNGKAEKFKTGYISFNTANAGTGTLEGFKFEIEVYMRYLLDVEKLGDLDTYVLPLDDFVANNRNYKRGIGYAVDLITVSSETQVEPTEYGLADNGQYFKPPYSFFSEKFYPVARSTWGLSSIWFNFNMMDFILEEKAHKEYTMKDAILISDVIKVLLKEIAPELTHEATSEYSEFLYGNTNPISLTKFRVMITQKSNILAGEYDRPAQKAPIRLSYVTKMLRDIFRCFWYVDGNKFKLEHISWFKNGGRYNGNPVLTVDLIKLIEQHTKKPYAFNSSSYSYDKPDLAERIECGWMDDVTEGFKGFPVTVNSKYVQAGKIDNVNPGSFTTDVDYMLLNPEGCSQDGFALFAATIVNDKYVLPFIQMSIDGAELRLQNGMMSWCYIQPTFWMHDMPAKNITINGNKTYAYGITRKKKQTVEYPSLVDPDPMKLVKTYIGNGQIQKISINLSSRMNKIQLNYDTE